MAHSHHMHREHQVSHRRVHKILEEAHPEAKKHSQSHAFSKVTSKTAAEHHDKVSGHKGAKRYARGGKVKGGKGHQTNIAVVVPQHHPLAPPPTAGATGGPPPGGPPPLPPAAMAAMMGGAGGPGGAPGGMPPPPMRKRGGKVADGESTNPNIKTMAKRASSNSYARGGHIKAGAATGVGREEQAEAMRRRKGRM